MQLHKKCFEIINIGLIRLRNYFSIIYLQKIDFAENTESEDMSSDLQLESNENLPEDGEIIEETQVESNNEIGKSKSLTLTKPKKVRSEDPRIDETFRILKNIEAKKARRTEKTESTLYGEYVASQLEKFDPHTRAVVKHKFATILFEAEMGTYGALLPAAMHPNPSPQWSNPESNSSAISSTPLPSPNYGQQPEQRYQEKQTSGWDATSATNTDSTPAHFPEPGSGPVVAPPSMARPSTSTNESSPGFAIQYTQLF